MRFAGHWSCCLQVSEVAHRLLQLATGSLVNITLLSAMHRAGAQLKQRLAEISMGQNGTPYMDEIAVVRRQLVGAFMSAGLREPLPAATTSSEDELPKLAEKLQMLGQSHGDGHQLFQVGESRKKKGNDQGETFNKVDRFCLI